jgi:hypothetical protein
MERSELFDLMGELQLYGMKAAFDEIMTTAVKRQHEPQRIIGDLLTAEINEKQARSIKYQLTIAKLPLAKDLADFQFEGTPINETLVRDLAAVRSLPNSATPFWSAVPSPLHDAHLSMPLEFQHFLHRIAGQRTSQTPGGRSVLHVGTFQIGRLDDPRRALTELIRRELTILD